MFGRESNNKMLCCTPLLFADSRRVGTPGTLQLDQPDGRRPGAVKQTGNAQAEGDSGGCAC